MAIDEAIIKKFCPWGNAQLTFAIGAGILSEDSETGNYYQSTVEREYLAYLNIQPPSWDPKFGVDHTTYQCKGRLLNPCQLDDRITNGSQANAIVNGVYGRFELTFPLAIINNFYKDIRQEISGIFRKIGGPDCE